MTPPSPSSATEQHIRSEELKVHSATLKRAIEAWEEGIEEEAMIERFGRKLTQEAVSNASADRRGTYVLTSADCRKLRDPRLNYKLTRRGYKLSPAIIPG